MPAAQPPGRSSAESRPIARADRGRSLRARPWSSWASASAPPGRGRPEPQAGSAGAGAGLAQAQALRTARAACRLLPGGTMYERGRPRAAGPESAGPRRHGHAGRADRPCRIGGACQLRAWGKGPSARAARAVRSAEARSLAGRVSLGLGPADSEVRTRNMRSARSGSLLTGLTVRLPQLVLGPPTRGHATLHTVTETRSESPRPSEHVQATCTARTSARTPNTERAAPRAA